MNLLRLLLSLFRPGDPAALPAPAVRPPWSERPARPPAMLVEEVDGGYLLSSRAFCRALPPGFEEMPLRPDPRPGEEPPEEPPCGWSPPVLRAPGRGRLFYARVPPEWLSSAADYPGVLCARDWSAPWGSGAGAPLPVGWWRTQFPLASASPAPAESGGEE